MNNIKIFYVVKDLGRFYILDELFEGEGAKCLFEGPLDACERFVAFADIDESKPETPKPDGVPF